MRGNADSFRNRLVFGFSGANAIAHAAHGVNQFQWKWFINLFADIAHVDIHDIRDAFKTLIPHMIQYHGAREHPLRTAHEILEQSIFLRSKFNLLAIAPHLLRSTVHFQIGHAQHIVALRRRAAQLSFYSHQQLRELEGLGQLVIRAGFEMHHFAVDFIPRREHQDRECRMRAAYAAQKLGATHLRQHEIEDQQIVIIGEDILFAVPAVGRQIDCKAFRAQSARHELRQLAIVLDEQYSHPRLLSHVLDPIKIRKCLENGNPSWNCRGEWRDTTAEGVQDRGTAPGTPWSTGTRPPPAAPKPRPGCRYFSLTTIEFTIFASPLASDAADPATASCKSLATLPYK